MLTNTTCSNEVNYCNDFFFKYALGSEDEDSTYIRNTIIERVTGIHPKESIVLNPNLDPTLLAQKQSILDIHVKDEQGHEYDFEMQTTFLQASEWKRFEYYGANMLSKQLVEGENYRQLQPIYQIIFVNACPQNEKRLINRYIMRDPYGEAESKEPLLHRIYIQLPMIDEIAKEKGMEAMNDFEQVCYLFKNNANHAILKTKERLVRKLMEKHEKFKDDEGLWSLAMSRQMAEWREKNNLLDSYDEGKKKGVIDLLSLQIKQKFAIDAKEWLSTLSLSQLYEFDSFKNEWSQYPGAVDVWVRNFAHIEQLYDYGSDVRKVMYTTNAIESINSSFRKVTKKGSFPNENALFKLLYLRSKELEDKWDGGVVRNWSMVLNQLMVNDKFKNRIDKYINL